MFRFVFPYFSPFLPNFSLTGSHTLPHTHSLSAKEKEGLGYIFRKMDVDW